ncbi:hypothetical protein [Streptomyces sp. NRRL S-646]|uniref:hypothetical protein n=1 Tax=Streptomyces sp. NRRL S-646 TaxID=1463917 RepID=UPI0004CBFDCE|nr:hypothetical protein [Streptomyces sp. NRRL S-646]
MSRQLSPERSGASGDVRERTRRQVREGLEDSGIDSFDALVDRLAEVDPPILHEDAVMMIGGIRAEGESPPPKPHQPPEIPVVLDGETNEPSVVREFDGQELYSTPGVNAQGDPVLYSFTTLEALHDHLVGARHSDIGTTNPDSLSELSYYYEDDDLGGDWLQNGPGRAWRDLRRVRRGFLGTGDWNDIISSVNWCRWHITLWDTPGYRGSRLEIPGGNTRYHLSQYGWNDCTSSTANWGRRF